MAKKQAATVQAVTTATTVALPALPKMAKSATRKAKTLKACMCGCGGTTYSKFTPGHDSRLNALVLRVERGLLKLEDPAILPGQRPVVKAEIAKRKAAGAAPTKGAAPRAPKHAEGDSATA